MTIHNLPPGNYLIKIEEPYVSQEDQIFVFDMNLEEETQEQVCKYRDFYPWYEL